MINKIGVLCCVLVIEQVLVPIPEAMILQDHVSRIGAGCTCARTYMRT